MTKKDNKSFVHKLSNHPVILIISIIASITGIIGWNLLDALNSNNETKVATTTLASTQFRKEENGWVSILEFEFTTPSVLLRTITPAGDLYELISYINPEIRISENAYYISFDSTSDNDGKYPVFEIEDSKLDKNNILLEPRGFFDDNPSPYMSFPLITNHTMFIRLDDYSIVRLHVSKLPNSFGSKNIILIISYITNNKTRFDNLLAP